MIVAAVMYWTEKRRNLLGGIRGIIREVVVTLRCLVLFFCEIRHFILEVEFLINSSAGNSSTKICYFLRKSSVQAKKRVLKVFSIGF